MPLPSWLKSYFIATTAGLGPCLAVVISWSLHKSVIWAVIQGLFGWFYVVFHILTTGRL